MFSSQVPPYEQWVEVEQEHLRNNACTESDLPWRLFCGRNAVAATAFGPRCRKHLKAEERRSRVEDLSSR